jgi:type I restriction enzyme S subunit
MKIVPLGDVVDILDNMRVPINSTERAKRQGQVPYYGATGQVGTIDEAIFNETLILLGEDGVPFFDSAKHKAYEISGPAWVNNHAHVLRAKSELIVQRYLLHFLNGFNYSGYVNGATRLKLTQGDMKRIPIPLPSLEKQREIVERLDSAFAEIENARNQLRQRDDSFTRLEAELIDERLSRNLGSLIKKPLKEITSKIGSGATPRGGEESYKSEGIALIRSLNVYDDGFRMKKLAHIDDIQAKALSNVEVQVGDVLLNITGASIARTCLAPKEYLPARVNQHVSIIRPEPEIIRSDYLHYVLRSESMKNKLLGVGNSGGSTRQALTKVDLENTIISFPSEIEDQKKVVDELNSLGELSQIFKDNLLRIEKLFSALASSLLSSVFSERIA